MIRVMDGLPDNVLGVEAIGKVNDEDYERVLTPAVEEKLAAHDKIRCVYVLGEEFEGWTLGGLWADAKLGGGELGKWEKIAVVTDKDWIRHTVQGFGWMIPGDVKVFAGAELDDAKVWVST
jgi:SpoIIAA-like